MNDYYNEAKRNLEKQAPKLKDVRFINCDYKSFSDDMDFTETGSGWINDKDGNKALHLRKGKYISLNYQPFKENPAYGTADNQGNKKR